jgi:polyphosphate kinase 2 (PPK2 family)
VNIIKLWFSISKEEQSRRFESRKNDPLKQWKLSPIDKKSQGLWDRYTYFKLQMFSRSHTNFAPWIIVDANVKKIARLESIRYVLSLFDYDGKLESSLQLIPDPDIVKRYNRSLFYHFESK